MLSSDHNMQEAGVSGLENLLSLDGEIFVMQSGYWVKFEVSVCEKTKERPLGIRYSLTLHDRHNRRVIGYDNAHSYRPKHRRYGARKESWDHIHKQMEILPYEFDTAFQLMEDFWNSVEQYLKNVS